MLEMLNGERRIFLGVVFSVGMDYLSEYLALRIKYFRGERYESVFGAGNKRECTHRSLPSQLIFVVKSVDRMISKSSLKEYFPQ
jgi:hypothetical protein